MALALKPLKHVEFQERSARGGRRSGPATGVEDLVPRVCFALISDSLLTGLCTMLNSDEPSNEIDFDGGTTGCGELLLDLLLYMKRQAPGTEVTVRALDPGAPLEIPAWCRMTQHELIEAKHPLYLLRKP